MTSPARLTSPCAGSSVTVRDSAPSARRSSRPWKSTDSFHEPEAGTPRAPSNAKELRERYKWLRHLSGLCLIAALHACALLGPTHISQGKQYLESADHESAISELKAAASEEHQAVEYRVEALELLGDIYAQNDQRTAARTAYRDAIQLLDREFAHFAASAPGNSNQLRESLRRQNEATMKELKLRAKLSGLD